MTPQAPKIELVLCVSAASEKCQRALRTVHRVLDRYDSSQVSFTVRDLSHRPASGDEDAVVFTPTLVKRGPGTRTWIGWESRSGRSADRSVRRQRRRSEARRQLK